MVNCVTRFSSALESFGVWAGHSPELVVPVVPEVSRLPPLLSGESCPSASDRFPANGNRMFLVSLRRGGEATLGWFASARFTDAQVMDHRAFCLSVVAAALAVLRALLHHQPAALMPEERMVSLLGSEKLREQTRLSPRSCL